MSGINIKFGATDAGFTSTVNKVKDSTKSLDTTVAKTSSSVNASFASMAKAGAALALGFGAINPHFPALRSAPMALSGASRIKQTPCSHSL